MRGRSADRVFFAGEATEPVEYGTVHAALWSAEQAAEAIFERRPAGDATRDRASVGRARAARGGKWLMRTRMKS